MDEDILAAVFARHEAEALGVVEPFDLARDADTAVDGSGGDAARPRRIAKRALRRRSTALDCVDLQHAGHLRALRAGADLYAKFRARRHRLVTRPMQRVHMQERVALAVGQFDEAVSLVRLEPLDDRIHRRAPGSIWRRGAARRRAAKAAAGAPP